MAEALRLLVRGSARVYAVTFGLLCLALQVFLPFRTYVRWLKWLTLALLSYVAVVFTAQLDGVRVASELVHPRLAFGHDMMLMVVAVFGTTISPCLFFWQAVQEMEDTTYSPLRGPPDMHRHLRSIKADTIIGMGFSNLVALFFILSTAATLHAAGVTDIQTSAQAAEALRRVAGEFTFLPFSLGLIGTGLLAIPMLAGSAGCAVAEAAGRQGTLSSRLDKGEGRGFYGVIAVSIMTVMMLLASRAGTMGSHVIGPRLQRLVWAATAVMARIREHCAQAGAHWREGPLGLSAGTVELGEQESSADFVPRADEAMYRRKAARRSRTGEAGA